MSERQELIDWLEWNDPNGCYSDEDCDLEGLPRLTAGQLQDYKADQLEA